MKQYGPWSITGPGFITAMVGLITSPTTLHFHVALTPSLARVVYLPSNYVLHTGPSQLLYSRQDIKKYQAQGKTILLSVVGATYTLGGFQSAFQNGVSGQAFLR